MRKAFNKSCQSGVFHCLYLKPNWLRLCLFAGWCVIRLVGRWELNIAGIQARHQFCGAKKFATNLCGCQSKGQMSNNCHAPHFLFATYTSQKPPILLADRTRFFKSTRAFRIQTLEMSLNVTDVSLEILPDQISECHNCWTIAWNKRPLWSETCGTAGWTTDRNTQYYNLRDQMQHLHTLAKIL